MALTTVTGNMVSVNAIQGTLIADNAITAVHIASNAVTSIQIAENNVTAREIASNSITVAQLADASVESDKIANGVITTNHLNSAMISSQTEVTAVAGDFVLLGDTSDSNNLKKTPVSSIVALVSGTTINNNADNRVITGSGTANTLEGEANLTFNGSTLALTGTATMDGLTVDGEGRIEETGAAARFVISRTDALNTAATASVDLLEGSAGGSFGSANNYGFSIDLNGSTNTLNILSGNQTAIKKRLSVARDTGDISFYEDTGTTAKMAWDPAATRLTLDGAETSRSSNTYLLDIDNSVQTSNLATSGPFRLKGYYGDSMTINGRGDVSLFNEAGAAKFYWDASAESLGIGTSSPSYALDVNTLGHNSTGELLLSGGNSASNDYTQSTLLRLRATSINPNSTNHNSINAAVAEIRLNHTDLAGNASSGIMTFHTNPGNNTAGALAERIRIDSSGRVGIGTTAPAVELHVYSADQNALKIQTNTAINQIDLSNSTNSPCYITQSSYALQLKADDNGWGGTASSIQFNVKGSEVARLTTGSLGLGTSNPTARLHLYDSTSNPINIGIQNSTRYYKIEVNSGNLQFFDVSAYVERMRISSNGSIGAPNGTNIYNASDERLKQNISTLTNGIDVINALNPVQFNWVDNFEESENGKTLYGFVAQEVQDVFPDAVESFGNGVEVDGTVIENPLTVRDKFFIPVLVKAMQEQQALIESLTARITTLEG